MAHQDRPTIWLMADIDHRASEGLSHRSTTLVYCAFYFRALPSRYSLFVAQLQGGGPALARGCGKATVTW